MELNYPNHSMVAQVAITAKENPGLMAYDFMGKQVTYATMMTNINQIAASFAALGVTAGQRVCLCMPNCPHGVEALYAINRLGAVACMVHPLSSPHEIAYYVNHSESSVVVTLDLFYPTVQTALDKVDHPCTIVVTDIPSQLPTWKRWLYPLVNQKRQPLQGQYLPWKSLVQKAGELPPESGDGEDIAVLLYSGGTTGKPKGICLTNNNLNALALQTVKAGGWDSILGDKMLSVMPMFHGFGLGIGIHTPFVGGGQCILVPRFTPDSYAKLVKTKKPQFIPGVPSLFAALLQAKPLQKTDLSFLKGVFSGGDSLPPALKKQVDTFLKERGSPVPIREGYGTTECVTASCLTPAGKEKEGSIGLPYPDTFYAVVAPDTITHLPPNTEGEICLRGPSVMAGYLNDEESTRQALKCHADGHLWLHTGDLGTIDEEGYVYFKGRIKRMIVTNGYNVYPAQIEEVLMHHPAITECCIIGVKDPIRGQRVCACVVAKEPITLEECRDFCRQSVARYALPKELILKESLPKTAVGKIAYRKLEEEANEKAQPNL